MQWTLTKKIRQKSAFPRCATCALPSPFWQFKTNLHRPSLSFDGQHHSCYDRHQRPDCIHGQGQLHRDAQKNLSNQNHNRWRRSVYCHPVIQGPRPEPNYKYVLLLGIILGILKGDLTWQPLLRKLLVWQRMFAGTVTPRRKNGGNVHMQMSNN